MNRGQQELKKGRGAQLNIPNRFSAQHEARAHTEGIDDWEEAAVKTLYFHDQAKTIVNKVTSPDVGMAYSLNPYQGCEHGCIYCYARNSHEYWGYSAGLDFESRIIIKDNAPDLLLAHLSNPRWEPVPISISGNTDCYQPVERKVMLTRRLLEIFLKYKHPVGLITKNALILRDLDILQQLAHENLVQVFISITGCNNENFRLKAEPRTATYARRFEVVKSLSDAGIPVGIMNAPIIPGLNDDEMPAVLKKAAECGAQWAGYTFVRLNGAIGDIFVNWLQQAFPEQANKVLRLISEGHEGKLNDSRFGTRMKGEGAFAETIRNIFRMHCRRNGLNQSVFRFNTDAWVRPPKNGQLTLF